MFTNILFVILVLLLINFTFEVHVEPWIESAWLGFFCGFLLYFALLGLILLQSRYLKRGAHILINLELLAFLCLFHFFFGATRVINIPSQALLTLFSISLYAGGLFVYHFGKYKKRNHSPCSEALVELRMVTPFMVPFLLFTFMIDLLHMFPSETVQTILKPGEDDLSATIALLSLSGAFLVLVMIFFPLLLQWMWKCRPLKNSELTERLNSLCERARFKHAGLRTWTVMASAMTAAIIGVVPRFRYVMFTERLLNELPPESVEAVLVHEIGHSHYKHLILFPFIIFGMLVSAGIFSFFISEPLANAFFLQNILHPSSLWELLYPVLIFGIYALIIALYFRIVLAFFRASLKGKQIFMAFPLASPLE